MYAVIETGGKQYRVQVGDELFIERIEGYSGEKVTFDQVLAVSDDSGFRAGTPLVEGVEVEAEVLKQGKGAKIIVFTYKAKKNEKTKQGHRQPYTRVRIVRIGDVVLTEKPVKAAKAEKAPKAEKPVAEAAPKAGKAAKPAAAKAPKAEKPAAPKAAKGVAPKPAPKAPKAEKPAEPKAPKAPKAKKAE